MTNNTQYNDDDNDNNNNINPTTKKIKSIKTLFLFQNHHLCCCCCLKIYFQFIVCVYIVVFRLVFNEISLSFLSLFFGHHRKRKSKVNFSLYVPILLDITNNNGKQNGKSHFIFISSLSIDPKFFFCFLLLSFIVILVFKLILMRLLIVIHCI